MLQIAEAVYTTKSPTTGFICRLFCIKVVRCSCKLNPSKKNNKTLYEWQNDDLIVISETQMGIAVFQGCLTFTMQ